MILIVQFYFWLLGHALLLLGREENVVELELTSHRIVSRVIFTSLTSELSSFTELSNSLIHQQSLIIQILIKNLVTVIRYDIYQGTFLTMRVRRCIFSLKLNAP